MKKKIPRRDILKIYEDLLVALNENKTEKIILTRVQIQISVPFDRLKNYILELRELGLIESETSLRLTQKGKDYLKDYEKILDFMKRMGLSYQRRKRSQETTKKQH
jgi:predicted transcriptional regulator